MNNSPLQGKSSACTWSSTHSYGRKPKHQLDYRITPTVEGGINICTMYIFLNKATITGKEFILIPLPKTYF